MSDMKHLIEHMDRLSEMDWDDMPTYDDPFKQPFDKSPYEDVWYDPEHLLYRLIKVHGVPEKVVKQIVDGYQEIQDEINAGEDW